MKPPKIRINFSDLLYDFVSPDLAKNMQAELPSREDCLEWTDNYRHAWAAHEARLITGMTNVLGVDFYKPVIDVSTAPFFMPQSDPVIVNFRYEPDQFVDNLAHELIHVLLTDNNRVQVRATKPQLDLFKTWQGMFGERHDFNTLVHIPVHAVLKHLYLDVLGEETRLARDIEESSTLADASAYTKAWNYVNSNDYTSILNRLKQSYASVD